MYRMNKGMLLAIVATTAVLTIITSTIGTGIFLQQANANKGTTIISSSNGDKCTILNTPTGNVPATKVHGEINSAGRINLHCMS